MSQQIVLIDDNLNDATLMRRVLERAGFAVYHAGSGEGGVALTAEKVPDCVLVDYRMPGMDGHEVCRQIRGREELRNIPILMLTGADSARNVVEGLEAGADDFVTKSSDIEVILARVRALLRVKEYQDRIVEQSQRLRELYEEVKIKSDRILALNQRFNRDLQFARTVQEALLPATEMRTPRAEVRSSYVPSETLSGDFYDYFEQDDKLLLFMADVSGHGLPAAILVSLLKSYIHSEAAPDASLADFMSSLNTFLVGASLPAQYATALILRIDEGKITWSNAAHPPFLLVRAATRTAEFCEMPGHLLGAMPDMQFEQSTLEVGSGDMIFSYTDGLTDRRNAEGEFYSLDSIARLLEESVDEDLSSVYRKLHTEVTSFTSTEEYRDDLAFILTRIV
jgi:serine phosphatase RsbU (regulator of sigma subunit)